MFMKRLRFFWLMIFGFLVITLSACTPGGSGSGTTVVYPRFAYVANYGDNTISIYTVDAATGQLRHNGYVAAGSEPASVTVDPSGKFAYAANYGDNTISAYTFDGTTGALTAVGTAVAAGTHPYAVVMDPLGRFAYALNAGSNNISTYQINASTGALTAGTAVPVP